MKNKLFKYGEDIYRIKSTFGTLINAVKVKSNTLRAKMGEHITQFELPDIQNLIIKK